MGRWVWLAWLGVVLCGCAAPSPPASENRETIFEHAWIDPETDFARYRNLLIAPVNIRRLLIDPWYERHDLRYSAAEYQKDLNEVAFYGYKLFENAFREDERFTVVKQPQPDTLIFEFSLVELTPSRAGARAAGFTAPQVSLLGQPRIAFEARLRDAETGEMVAAFAERRELRADAGSGEAPWYGDNEQALEDWAQAFVALLGGKMNAEDFDPQPPRLRSW